jgi:hypothetical protein
MDFGSLDEIFYTTLLFLIVSRGGPASREKFQKLAVITAYAFLGFCLFSIVLYAFKDFYADHGEPGMAVLGWYWVLGQPVYHDMEAPHRYSYLYGPMLFVFNGLFMKIAGPSIFSSKIGGILAYAAGFAFLLHTYKRIAGSRPGFIFTLCTFALFATYGFRIFSNRADSYLILTVILALWGAGLKNRTLSLAVFALALGVSVNLKIHAAFYFLPIAVLYGRSHGMKRSAAAVFAGALLSLAPFLAPNISLTGYLHLLEAMSKHGLSTNKALKVATYSIYVVIPLLTAAAWAHTKDPGCGKKNKTGYLLLFGSLLAGIAAVAVIALKPGAGRWHIMPFVPAVNYMLLQFAKQNGLTGYFKKPETYMNKAPLFILSFLCIAFITASERLFVLSWRAVNTDHSVFARDIEKIAREHEGKKIAMGYGDGNGYRSTYYRVLLVFKGHPQFIDAGAEMDFRLAGLPEPGAVIESLENCTYEIFIIPGGNEPFSMESFYGGLLFTETLRNAFLENYEIAGKTAHFDIHACRSREH